MKTRHTEINIKGEISEELLSLIKAEYGECAEIKEEEFIDPFTTDWYRETRNLLKPGDILRIDRQNRGISQKQLGEKLVSFSRQNISDMENSRKSISLNTARKLGKIFDKPASRYLIID
ncbi:MAG: helix-turn-helix transcriptional regulator [Spirochaetales bacterium]|nr:helix-turn-helix transcriptional regulator [Spirochaetales bacterium]